MTEPLSQLRRIRWAVRGALALGIAASVSANILHAEPNPIARTIAAWPPIALLIAVEMVGRAPVRRRLVWLRIVAISAIAGIAAWVSYWHMAGVAGRYGEEAVSAHLLPLSVDGLILMSSVTLVDLTARIRAGTSASHRPAPAPVNPTINGAAFPLASTAAPAYQSDASPGSGVGDESASDSPEHRRAEALARLLAGDWSVEQSAIHAGLSVRRFQTWADGAAAATRRPRGGARKTTPEPADQSMVGESGGRQPIAVVAKAATRRPVTARTDHKTPGASDAPA